jgi:hypothetical protein
MYPQVLFIHERTLEIVKSSWSSPSASGRSWPTSIKQTIYAAGQTFLEKQKYRGIHNKLQVCFNNQTSNWAQHDSGKYFILDLRQSAARRA